MMMLLIILTMINTDNNTDTDNTNTDNNTDLNASNIYHNQYRLKNGAKSNFLTTITFILINFLHFNFTNTNKFSFYKCKDVALPILVIFKRNCKKNPI